MDLMDARLLAIRLMREWGLPKHGFQFRWMNSIGTLGQCCTEKNPPTMEIKLSLPYVETASKESVENTIRHEIAHALDYIRNDYSWRRNPYGTQRQIVHDSVWRQIAKEVGATTDTTCPSNEAPMPNKSSRWVLAHMNTGEIFRRFHRRPRKDRSNYYIRGRREETLGKLMIMTTDDHKKLFGKG